MPQIPWPPTYTVKKHPRARSVKLRATLEHGLEFIVPPRFSLKHIPALLNEHKNWIEKQLNKLAEEQQARAAVELPEKIHLAAAGQTWRVDYIPAQTRLRLMTRPQQEIVLLGDIKNKTACQHLLTLWLKRQAKLHLPKQIMQLSEKLELPITKVTIRDQLTRLGSCSTDKSISLNYRLILLPENLATHIMIHELCHTVHMNHSEKFWRLVEKFDPAWEMHRQKTRKLDELLPLWLPN